MKLSNDNDLRRLARDIEEGEKTLSAIRDQVDKVVRLAGPEIILQGQRLIRAKAKVPHGLWLDWLATNCPSVHERNARRYINAANRTQSDSPLTLLKELYEPEPQSGTIVTSEPRTWTAEVVFITGLSRLTKQIKDSPIRTWPAEQRSRTQEILEPLAKQFWKLEPL